MSNTVFSQRPVNEQMTWETVRVVLRRLIDTENKQRPYSDHELAKELAKLGMVVARRTVTKYREAMEIPSTRRRQT